MKTITKLCEFCKVKFKAQYKEVKRGNGRFCSRSCFGKYISSKRPPKQPNVKCTWCNKSFYKVPSKIKNSKSGLLFCSRNCKDNAQKIDGIKELHPPHYGINSNGGTNYRKHLSPISERHCIRCGYSKYPEIIIAHHIDRDRTNNIKENIIALCPTCHDEDHFLQKDGRFHWYNTS